MNLFRLLLAFAGLIGFANADTTSTTTTTTFTVTTTTSTTFTVTTTTSTTFTVTTTTSTTFTVTTTTSTTFTVTTTTSTTFTVTVTTTTSTTFTVTTTTTTPAPVAPSSTTTTITKNVVDPVSSTTTTTPTTKEVDEEPKDVAKKVVKIAVVATVPMAVNITVKTCGVISAQLNPAALGVCAATINAMMAKNGGSNLRFCPDSGDQPDPLCLKMGPPADNVAEKPAGFGSYTGAEEPIADPLLQGCMYKCTSGRVLTQEDVRGRRLASGSFNVKTKHDVQSKPMSAAESTALLDDAKTVNADAIATQVVDVKQKLDAGTELTLVPKPASGGTVVINNAAIYIATGLTADDFKAASSSTPVPDLAQLKLAVVAEAPTIVVPPKADKKKPAPAASTSGAATPTVMGALAVVSLGALLI